MSFKKPPAFSKIHLLQGLETLGKLWSRNILPEDLERHYFLYWFVTDRGNIIQTAKNLQIHRNTIQGHFLKFGFGNKAVRLRHTWKVLLTKNKKASFETNFFKYYAPFSGSKKFTPEENKRLIALWKTRFSIKTLMAHYLFWALRTKKTKAWVYRQLDYSERHRIRLLTSILNPKTRDGFWLSALKPTVQEIYSKRYRSVMASMKKRS